MGLKKFRNSRPVEGLRVLHLFIGTGSGQRVYADILSSVHHLGVPQSYIMWARLCEL